MNEADSAARVWIPGGDFLMGSDRHYPEEGPTRRVSVAGFSIDRYLVTNARFTEFVAETGYVTIAERPLDPTRFPGAPPENLVPGSMVFTPDGRPGLGHAPRRRDHRAFRSSCRQLQTQLGTGPHGFG
jgi:formylglycine-generating enzyme required for sulfatase activity